jgi:hypothetical protein
VYKNDQLKPTPRLRAIFERDIARYNREAERMRVLRVKAAEQVYRRAAVDLGTILEGLKKQAAKTKGLGSGSLMKAYWNCTKVGVILEALW